MSRTFDTSTLKGLKAAERFKAMLNNKFESVQVIAVGWNRVCITGVTHEHGADCKYLGNDMWNCGQIDNQL